MMPQDVVQIGVRLGIQKGLLSWDPSVGPTLVYARPHHDHHPPMGNEMAVTWSHR